MIYVLIRFRKNIDKIIILCQYSDYQIIRIRKHNMTTEIKNDDIDVQCETKDGQIYVAKAIVHGKNKSIVFKYKSTLERIEDPDCKWITNGYRQKLNVFIKGSGLFGLPILEYEVKYWPPVRQKERLPLLSTLRHDCMGRDYGLVCEDGFLSKACSAVNGHVDVVYPEDDEAFAAINPMYAELEKLVRQHIVIKVQECYHSEEMKLQRKEKDNAIRERIEEKKTEEMRRREALANAHKKEFENEGFYDIMQRMKSR